MKWTRIGWITAALTCVLLMSCGGGDENNPGGTGGTLDSGPGDTGASAGKAGTGGTAGKAGSAGASGKAGSAGKAGASGSSGASGGGGKAGAAGASGQSGNSGAGGTSGSAGTGNAAGTAGTGTGGTSDAGPDADPDAPLDGIAPDGTSDGGCSAPCDDGIFCNGLETCSNGACVAGTAPDCNDSVSCTHDFCNSSTDQCSHVPDDGPCQDNSYCNGHEVCNAVSGCQPGTLVTCNDNVACTNDSCDDTIPGCKFTPDDTKCTDGLFCNGAETCDAVLDCKAGTPPLCDDLIPCTTDACDPGLNACKNTPDHTKCVDSFYCNGVEICDTQQGCMAGTSPCTPDNIACTVDCDEASQSCKFTPDNTLCPSGQFCIAAQGGCVAGIPCSSDPQCNDGKQCNGIETCVNSLCQPGTPLDCADPHLCTVDTCDDTLGCVHTPKDSICDDGDFCSGVETCSVSTGCVLGTPPDCSDTIPCTDDSCSTTAGKCLHLPSDGYCSDNIYCNGMEVCDVVQGKCVPGTPVTCPDDGIACTTDTCDAGTDKCVHIPDDSVCPCGQSCHVPGGCSNACTPVACAGKVYQCGDCLDNDNDCKVDAKDPECLGACDNTERGLWGGIPGQNSAPCKQDCYFDNDSGGGNDHCSWDHSCDPKEQGTPPYPEEKCKYEPSMIGGSNCPNDQPTECHAVCGPLTPNGCDCFGCCQIPENSGNWIWLGSITYSNNNQECTLADVNNPLKCHPCTPVADCLNTCAHCELCIGKPTLPADCTAQQCDTGVQPCGLPGQAECPALYYCISGCCQHALQ